MLNFIENIASADKFMQKDFLMNSVQEKISNPLGSKSKAAPKEPEEKKWYETKFESLPVIVKEPRYRKITYLLEKTKLLAKSNQKRHIAKIWKYKNIRVRQLQYDRLTDVQKERIKEHFVKEISEIVIANQLPFADLSETRIETLITLFEKFMYEQKTPINSISLLDYIFKNATSLFDWLEGYYQKKQARDEFYLRDKEKLNKKRRRKYSRFSFLKRFFKTRRAIRKGYIKSMNKKVYIERIKRRQIRLGKPVTKWNYGYLTINLKRRNAFLTVRKKAFRKNKINKFEVRLSNIYNKLLRNYSTGQLKTLKAVQNPVL